MATTPRKDAQDDNTIGVLAPGNEDISASGGGNYLDGEDGNDTLFGGAGTMNGGRSILIGAGRWYCGQEGRATA